MVAANRYAPQEGNGISVYIQGVLRRVFGRRENGRHGNVY